MLLSYCKKGLDDNNMNKKRYILVVVIIILGVISLVILNNKLANKETILDEVKLKENKVDKNSFAIMIQKEDKTGYEASTSNTWPTNMVYNNELSGCIDNYGSIIENSLTYNQETNKVTINTRVTSSCYLYFDLDKDAPIVSATVNNNNSTNATMTINSNETGTYCVNTSSTITDMSNCTFNGNITKDVSVTTSIFSTGGDYYVHVKDSAGNIGISSIVTITLATPLGQYIINNSISGLDKTFIGNETDGYDTLYRFSGTTGNTGINNYICLGTSTKCASGSDNMYRIIGVEPSTGYVKVIKQTKYGSNIPWNSSTGVTWPNSEAYSTMTTWYNSVSFKSMIVSHSWNIGDVGGTSDTYIGTRSTVMSYEDNTTTTAYVGMLAVSDYYLAYRGDQNWYNSYSNYTSNWIHLANNGNTSDTDWTMPRSSSYYAWFVTSNGRVSSTSMIYPFAVRPVFYLNSTVNWKSGTGISTDPFIVS